jgi:hypothetical protein
VLRADSLPVVRAAEFRHASRHGGSRSLVVRLEDGRLALVKFKGNPQSTRALVGDLVGTLLGRRVGAPFPEPVLVPVRFEDLAWMPALQERPWLPGLQFGAIFRPGAAPLRGPADVAALVNLDRLPAAALAEIWLHDVDLKHDHVMAVPGPAGPELLLVDHGHVFPMGPSWTVRDLRLYARHVPDVEPLTRVARAAGRAFDFSSAVAACESVGDEEIEALLRLVPREWGLEGGEARGLRSFLTQRRGRIRDWAAELAGSWNG